MHTRRASITITGEFDRASFNTLCEAFEAQGDNIVSMMFNDEKQGAMAGIYLNTNLDEDGLRTTIAKILGSSHVDIGIKKTELIK